MSFIKMTESKLESRNKKTTPNWVVKFINEILLFVIIFNKKERCNNHSYSS